MSCGYTGHEFGAKYPDSLCIDGYLWDADSGYPGETDGSWVYTTGGDIPCPNCNAEKFAAFRAEDGGTDERTTRR